MFSNKAWERSGQDKWAARRAGGHAIYDYSTAGRRRVWNSRTQTMDYDRDTHRKHSSSKEKLLSLLRSVNQGLNVIKM
jgi:hypothetical protein